MKIVLEKLSSTLLEEVNYTLSNGSETILLNDLIGKTWTDKELSKPLEESDILVVAAYNNQVRSIKQTLRKNDLKDNYNR
jgi:superfamily I DNA and/or RNA helicase